MTDLISRRAAIDAVNDLPNCYNGYSDTYDKSCIIGLLEELPSVQPAEAIPVAFLEEQAKWFESKDNTFAKIEANNIRVIIKKWRSEKDERSD